MKTPPDLLAAATPREDVMAGVLSDAVFAASLDEVVSGTAPETYRDADLFYAATHPSDGLKELLNAALGRISGGWPDAPPIIRLETNLGGGKTHNLIALWHAARGRLSPMMAMEFLNPTYLPATAVEQVAVFVGTSAGAVSFPKVNGSMAEARNVWEFLALQLGGDAAYEAVVGETAPGADALKRVLGDRPTLILVDELARYLATSAGHVVGSTTLARQTVAFLMALLEAIDASPHASLVVTTTEVTDAFGDQTQEVLDAISEAGELLARREHVLRPSGEADLPRILTRRLFQRVDAEAGRAVGEAYAQAAQEAYARGADLPGELHGASWSAAIEGSYPFHPALLRVLDKRLATIPNFQRTRGALRLLAQTVRHLWGAKSDRPLLLHPHHLDLSDGHTVEDLTSRLGRGDFEPVVRADIAGQDRGEKAHAEEIDERLGGAFARRLATTAFLFSLTADVPGIPASDLMGAVIAPGDDHNLLSKALDAVEQALWYLHVDDRGYRFSVEPSLVKLIQDAQTRVPLGKARTEATSILSRQFRDAALKVRRSWEDARVPDREDEAALVLLHWDDFGDQRGVDPQGPTPTRIQEIWEKTPAGGLRQYRNRLVFLAPSLGTHEAMLAAVRRHLALSALANDAVALRALSDEKRQELKAKSAESELIARVAVCNHVNVLYVPQAGGLEAVELSTVTQASVRPNQTDAILDRLAAMDKTLAAGDPPVDPGMVRTRLGVMLEAAVPTSTIVRAFAQRGDLKMVLDRAQLVSLVRAGVSNGIWEYQDTTLDERGWGTKERPAASIRLGEDTLLHPVGAAPTPKAIACPLCGKVHSGSCAVPPARESDGGGGSGGHGGPLRGSGSAGTAVANILQHAHDQHRSAAAAISVSIEELGRDTHQQLARLHSLVPGTTPAATVIYRVTARAALDSAGHTVSIEFDGLASDYQAVKSAVDQVLRTKEATLNASLVVTFDPAAPLDGDVIAAIAQRSSDTGPAKCTVELEPVE